MAMFNVGDLIIGTEENTYGITNKYAICEVTERLERANYIQVKVVDFVEGYPSDDGLNEFFPVDEKRFKLYKKFKPIEVASDDEIFQLIGC